MVPTFHKLIWYFGFADKEIKANQMQKAIHFTIHGVSTKLQQEQSGLAIRQKKPQPKQKSKRSEALE